MKPFRFALERLLWLRGLREREQARALGEALSDERDQREALTRAHLGLERASEQVGGTLDVPRPAGAVRNLGLTLQAAALAAEGTAEAHRAAMVSVEREQERFGEARKDRRVLEKLREKRRTTWNEDSVRDEQRESDSLTDARRQSRGEDK